MQKIDPEDIRKGDLIRAEACSERARFTALEYTATRDAHRLPMYWDGYNVDGYYLLERPEPPFEPYWGMVIGESEDGGVKAVYVPTGDGHNWFSHPEPEGSQGLYYFTDGWAKQKLAEGWVIIENPEGVK